MAYFVDKDGRYYGRTQRLDPTDIEVPTAPRDGKMIWREGAWQETPASLADKGKPVERDRLAALEAALVGKGLISKDEVDAKVVLARP